VGGRADKKNVRKNARGKKEGITPDTRTPRKTEREGEDKNRQGMQQGKGYNQKNREFDADGASKTKRGSGKKGMRDDTR